MSNKITFSLLVIILFVVSSFNQVFATIWEELEPQEIVDRADVIIVGNYNFSTEPIDSERTVPFCGMEFNVDKIYKGEVPDKITAGLDCNDLSLVEEFQLDGGRLLLFLERGGKVGFLIPVGGPNGIVKIKNGEIQDEKEERRAFFEEFLKEKNKKDNSLLFYITVSIIFGLAVIIIVYYKKRKKE